MAASNPVRPASTSTPTTKRNNSHMSPPDKEVQTKVTVLSPKFKELFLNTMRKEILRQNDGYETEDEVPLSQLRRRVTAQKTQHKAPQKVNKDDSILITEDDLSQNVAALNRAIIETSDTDSVEMKEGEPRRDTGGDTADAISTVNSEGGQVLNEPESKAISTNVIGSSGVPVDLESDSNKEQLIPEKAVLQDIPDTNTRVAQNTLDQLLLSIEGINKKLEKLDVLESEIRDMNENMLKKGDVDKMIKEQLVPVKTTLMKHEVRLKQHESELDNVKLKTRNDIDIVKQRVDSLEGNEMEMTAIDKKTVEDMIKKACEAERELKNVTNPEGRDVDTRRPNKNLIFHGMAEDKRVADLSKVQDVAHDIGVMLHRWDIDKTSRIGAYEKGKTRPIKVELVSEITKLDLLKSKKKLKDSALYADIQVVPDESKEVRHAKAILRQAAYLASKRGDRVFKRHDLIWVNGTKYTVETVEDIPKELRFKRKDDAQNRAGIGKDGKDGDIREKEKEKEKAGTEEDMDVVQPQDISEPQFKNRNWDQAARAAYKAPRDVEQEGAAHLTKRGLAFYTGKSFLSNFYLVEFKFNGRLFYSAEQAYQYEKAYVCRDSRCMERIYKAKTPKDAKDIAYEIVTTPLWERLKDDRMREVLDAKFSQNKEVRSRLMSTWGLYLIEGSSDRYWGAGKRLYSKDLMDGNWNGQNKLGEMLVELRNDLRRRGY